MYIIWHMIAIYIYIHMTFVYTQVNAGFNDFKKELHLQVQQGPCFSPLCFVGPSKKTSFYEVSWVLPGAAGVLGDWFTEKSRWCRSFGRFVEWEFTYTSYTVDICKYHIMCIYIYPSDPITFWEWQWNLNTLHWGGDWTPQSSTDKVIGSLGYIHIVIYIYTGHKIGIPMI